MNWREIIADKLFRNVNNSWTLWIGKTHICEGAVDLQALPDLLTTLLSFSDARSFAWALNCELCGFREQNSQQIRTKTKYWPQLPFATLARESSPFARKHVISRFTFIFFAPRRHHEEISLHSLPFEMLWFTRWRHRLQNKLTSGTCSVRNRRARKHVIHVLFGLQRKPH